MTLALPILALMLSTAGQAGWTADQLVGLSESELLALYRRCPAASVPAGRVRGTVLPATGRPRDRLVSRGARLIWQGKTFQAEEATAINRFFGLPLVRGALSSGPSWFDGGPALVLDYRETSLVYGKYRDELRQVAPGLALGLMYDTTTCPPRIVRYFAIEVIE